MRSLRIFAFLTTVGLLALPAAPASGAAPSKGVPPEARVAFHRETGKVRFMGSAPGRPMPRPTSVGAAASSARIARAFLERYGRAFGIADQSEELHVRTTRPAPSGRSVVRFQQVHRGVPVLGGELVVNLQADGDVLSASGEVLPDPGISVDPLVTASEARRAAIAAVGGKRGEPGGLKATDPALWIHDSRILGGPGFDIPTLVWRMDVRGEGPTDELVLVDARLGNVALRIDQIEEAKDRDICDAANTSAHYPCISPVRQEGGPPHAVADVNAAYNFSGDTYDFFFTNFGRDSLDDAGMTLVNTVRWCHPDPSAPCPYPNAFWDGAQMVYGQGFAVDDVVGHELTHGVTDFESHLFYYYQSGAINESLSDVFGEFVDLVNGAGTDTPATRWLLGEDIPGIGAIRDMENPPAFGDPDRMTSPNYTADTNELDGGGVHTNSGVNNKAAFLITDGASFNGQTVTGLGITKAAHIYYEAATNLLTSASDYADLATALPQACTNKIGTAGITAGDCTEVSDAVAAVEMATIPPAAPNPEAPVCDTGSPLTTLFTDDLENPGSGNWQLQNISGINRWFYPQNSNPFGFDATYATSGTTNFWGYDQGSIADYSIRRTADTAIPGGGVLTFLRFNHAYGFEDDPDGAYDGGVLEYSTNGGSSWIDAGPLFTHGGYSGTIASGFGNPLSSRSAFVRESNGYISSRVNLSSLAGQNVRFRFRIGTDNIFDDLGWFVDDVKVYTCIDTDPPETTITSGPQGPTNDTTPTFEFTSDEPNSTFMCRVPPAPFADCPSPHTITPPLADGAYSFEVKAKDAANNEDSTPATRAFAVDTLPPDTTISSGPSGPTTDATPTFEFASTEPGSFTCRVDANPFAACSSPHTTATLAVGPHTFEVRASDLAGNVDSTPAVRAFTVEAPPPSAVIGNAKKKEPDKGKKAMSFTVTLSTAPTAPVTISFATKNGSAKAPKDYGKSSGTLTFQAGVTSLVVKVMIRGDVADEKNEKFSVILSGATGGTIGDGTGVGTIKDND